MANILVVDDSLIIQENIKRILCNIGHNVVGFASSSKEAFEQYKELKPDLVTMDITMPQDDDENGIDAVKHIISFDKNAKIVMITSHGEQNKVIMAVNSGASNYIMKPFKDDNLQDVINKTLDKSSKNLNRRLSQ